MAQKTVAILHPGEMGAAIGAGLAAHGHRVVWVSAGRGSATRRRADENGLEDVETLARAAREADIAFSVCPPHAALELWHFNPLRLVKDAPVRPAACRTHEHDKWPYAAFA